MTCLFLNRLFFSGLIIDLSVIGILADAHAYDGLIEKMIGHFQKAGALRNQGYVEKSDNEVKRGEKAFNKAIRLDPELPDAYLNIAQFYLNSKQYDISLPHFNLAKEKVRNSGQNPKYVAMIDNRIQQVHYAKASKVRDEVYQGGQGNMDEALKMVNKQLEIFPEHPANLHDKGTILANLGAVQDRSKEAIASWNAAQKASVEMWTTGCSKTRELVLNWRKATEVKIHEIPGQDGVNRAAYIAEFPPVQLSGDDGIISTKCSIYVPSNGAAINLSANIPMTEKWTDGRPFDPFIGKPHVDIPVREIKEAASVIQMASSQFYHNLIEVGARLMLLKKFLGEGEKIKIPIIVPASKTTQQLIKMLKIENPIIEYTLGRSVQPRMKIKKLWYADWPSCPLEEDGCHCTPPEHLIRELQAAFVPTPSSSPGTPRTLFLQRGEQSMRNLINEKEVIESFAGAEAYNPADFTLDNVIEDFRSVTKIIGVHGAALANAIFLQPNSTVIELGWPQVPIAGHFRHLARALRLHLETLPLEPDPRGIAAYEVTFKHQRLLLHKTAGKEEEL